MMTPRVRWLLAAPLLVASAAVVQMRGEQPVSQPALSASETMIATRDGARLYTQVYTPKAATAPLPILLLRTPYGTGALDPARMAAALPELTAEGFIIVVQDIRGRFKSEGTFVMLRQPRERKDAKAIDESTDTYDTIDWLLANVPGHNGRVGMAGTSYGAWLAVMGMLDPHPALKAVVPQASPADMWIGDDFHHNGSFRLSYGLEYAYRMESSKEMVNPAAIIDTLRHLRVVPESGTSDERQRQVFPRKDSELERFRQAS